MKRMVLVAICGLLAVAAMGHMAAAAGPPASPAGPPRLDRNDGLGPLMRCVHANLQAEALAQICGQPLDTLRGQLARRHLFEVLKEYNVSAEEFAKAMQAKATDAVARLAQSGLISADQQQEILTQMDQHAQRRAIIDRLIAKAVQDGTITADQARMLAPPPR